MVAEKSDGTGLLLYLIILIAVVLAQLLFVRLLEVYAMGVAIIFITMCANFVIIIAVIYLIYQNMFFIKNLKFRSKPPFIIDFKGMLKVKFLWYLLVASFLIVGTSQSFIERQEKLALNADAVQA